MWSLNQPTRISSDEQSVSVNQASKSSNTSSTQLSYTFKSSHQHEYPRSHSHYKQSAQLSHEEWNLILSFRMMKNLAVSQPYATAPHRHTDILSNEATSFPIRSDHEVQSYELFHKTMMAMESLQHNETSSTLPCIIPSGTKFDTVSFPNEMHYDYVQNQLPHTLPSQNPLKVQRMAAATSPQSQLIFSDIISSPKSASLDEAKQLLLPVKHIGLSSKLPLEENGSPVSSLITIKEPIEESFTLDSHSATSRQQWINQDSSIDLSHLPTSSQLKKVHKSNSLIVEQVIELLDSTKPYRIGDTIKVGGRILQSDVRSLKYWIEDDIAITKTPHGGYILSMAGYSYFVKNNGKNFTTWECEYRRRHRCSSIVVRSSNPQLKNYFRIYSMQGEHVHVSTSDNIEIRKFKQRVRDRCRYELCPPRAIYEDELRKGKYSAAILALLPTFYNMQAQLYRIRQDHLPTSPTDPKFRLHPGFAYTDQGKRFLLYDSNDVSTPFILAPPEVGRLLIFTSDLQLSILSDSNRIGSDGTFATAPQVSYQNYIIMGDYQGKHTVPLVFCICQHKNFETYSLIIKTLKTAIEVLELVWNPVYWMSDYEEALTKAIKEELPNTKLLGCAFHYCQSIYRNIQNKGLQDAYQNIEIVRQILRQVMALAYIPKDQIREMYHSVVKTGLTSVPTNPVSIRQNLRTFFKYYESYWLNKIDRICVFNEPTRTNNDLEGYNNKMNIQLSAHPSLYRLILWFKKEELLVQQIFTKVDSNIPVHKRKQSAMTIMINDSLQGLWNDHTAGKISVRELLLESSKWVAKTA